MEITKVALKRAPPGIEALEQESEESAGCSPTRAGRRHLHHRETAFRGRSGVAGVSSWALRNADTNTPLTVTPPQATIVHMIELGAIRRYTATDESAAMDVWSRASRIAHPFICGEGEGERARKMREVYLVHAENWVAASNGRVVALLGLLDAEIGGLFVAPEAQGKGVGRQLVAHAAALRGPLTLDVYEKNVEARHFYARMDFVEESRRVDDDYDEVMLKLVRPAPKNQD